MYLGFYTSNITRKNQLVFPSKLGKQTGKKLLLTSWFENSVIILPYDSGKRSLDEIMQGSSSLLPETRDLQRFFFSNAKTVELDLKNRFVLSEELKRYARIGLDAVFLGVGERIELWDRSVYENYGKIREVQIRETAINHYNRIVKQRR